MVDLEHLNDEVLPAIEAMNPCPRRTQQLRVMKKVKNALESTPACDNRIHMLDPIDV